MPDVTNQRCVTPHALYDLAASVGAWQTFALNNCTLEPGTYWLAFEKRPALPNNPDGTVHYPDFPDGTYLYKAPTGAIGKSVKFPVAATIYELDAALGRGMKLQGLVSVLPIFTLTVTKSGTGNGTIISTPAGIDCGTDCSQAHNEGTSVTLTAVPESRSSFSGWSGACNNTSGTCTVTMDAAKNVIASFAHDTWSLVFVDSQDPVGYPGANAFDGNPNTFWHTEWRSGEVVPNPPHEIQIDTGISKAINGFTYLPRQDGISNGNIGQYEFYVSDSSTTWGTPVITGTLANTSTLKTVSFPTKTGRYIRLRALTDASGSNYMNIAELGIQISTTNPANYTLTTSASNGNITGNITTYAAGMTATVTAVPNTGYAFSSWSGGCSGTTNLCVLTMNENKEVTANFTLIPMTTYALSTSKIGTGSGNITGNTSPYNINTIATLTAVPEFGSSFSGWSGACTNISGTCTITMDATKSVVATFAGTEIAHYTFDNTFNDISGNGNNGTSVGPTYNTTVKKIGTHALSFNGTSNYSTAGTAASMNTINTAVSISTWIYKPASQT